MTEEKKPVEPTATDTRQGNPVPDPSRRRLAKAALVAPVIMTLGPRTVLGRPKKNKDPVAPANGTEEVTPVCSVATAASITTGISPATAEEPRFIDQQLCRDCLEQHPVDQATGDSPCIIKTGG